MTVGAGRTWGGRIPMGPRILSMMSAAGEIVRGPNAGQWYTSRPAWVSMREWLGEEVPAVWIPPSITGLSAASVSGVVSRRP